MCQETGTPGFGAEVRRAISLSTVTDALQRPLVPRSRFRQQLKAGVRRLRRRRKNQKRPQQRRCILLASRHVLQKQWQTTAQEADNTPMSTVQDIENAIRQLSPEDLTALRTWFAAFDAEQWDQQFEEDVAAGRLEYLAQEAIQDLQEGRCTDL